MAESKGMWWKGRRKKNTETERQLLVAFPLQTFNAYYLKTL